VLEVRVENLSPWDEPSARREHALLGAMIGTHVLLRDPGGGFLSLLDPPEWAERAAQGLRQVGLYPVLAHRRELVLAAPVILYDHPQVAPESPGDLFDATEIDEILTLRTRLLTDEEKREARATEPRVAALIDRVDTLDRAQMDRLHGTFRGKRVRLKPGARLSDAQDMFLTGKIATVQGVMQDVEGRDCLAVTLEDDPSAELNIWHGRYHYFYSDEVEPLT
jgi:hypothetical protein